MGAADLLLSVLMIAGFLLVIGGAIMIARQRDRTKAILMIVCGFVMWGNVAIMVL